MSTRLYILLSFSEMVVWRPCSSDLPGNGIAKFITITTIGAYTRGFIFIPLGYKRDTESPSRSVENWSASRLQGDLLKDRCFGIVFSSVW